MARKKAATQTETTQRELLEQQMTNVAILAQALSKQVAPGQTAQAMVGVRNVSDLTVGVPGAFGQPDLHLLAAINPDDPNTSAVIPFVWWRELRKGRLVQDGYLVRDDSILGAGYQTAPEDRPGELAAGHELNTILDPVSWIESRTEEQLRRDIDRITSLNSLRRIRRAVDQKLRSIVNSIPDVHRDFTPASNGYVPKDGWDNRHKLAVERLPALYRLVDELTTRKIEGAD